MNNRKLKVNSEGIVTNPNLVDSPVTLVKRGSKGTITMVAQNISQLCLDMEWSEKQLKRIIKNPSLAYDGWRVAS